MKSKFISPTVQVYFPHKLAGTVFWDHFEECFNKHTTIRPACKLQPWLKCQRKVMEGPNGTFIWTEVQK